MGAITSYVSRLFDGFVKYHQNGRRMLAFMGAFGLFAYPTMYFLRFYKSSPVYDDLWLRIIDTFLCFLLLRRGWPEQLQRYYMHFSYVAVIVMLPYSMVLTGLKNGGGTVAVANSMMATFLVILLTDWRNTIVTLVLGIGLGVLNYYLTEASPTWPKDYVERMPVVLVACIAASLIKRALEETTKERTEVAERQQREGRVAALQETIGFMAHELNTPLAEVRVLTGAIRDAFVEREQNARPYFDTFEVRKAGDVVRMLDRIEKRAADSQDLVQRLMRSAYHVRYDGGPQALTASSLVQSLRENYPFPDDKGPDFIEIVTVSDFVLAGSRELLYLVLSTLIQNSLLALRGRAAPRLVIEIVGNASGNQRGMIRVTDNGCGVPPDVLSRLTKEAVPSGWKSGQGGGMGLVFCQRIMEANGGEVSIESMAGKGTIVTLNFRSPPDVTESPASAPAALHTSPQPLT